MAMAERVHMDPGRRPADYHCDCSYCSRVLGELVQPGGGYYSRLERRKYYSKSEMGKTAHVAKTPLHVARWAVQQFTSPGDWVLDPTIGAGTTAVEALTNGRNVAGMELQFDDILKDNVSAALALANGVRARMMVGDAREVGAFLDEVCPGVEFSLVVNNPPYSGDEHMSTIAPEKGRHQSGTFRYASGLPNLAFLKEGPAYWEAIESIYRQCIERLKPGGYFVTGIKDMMRNKSPMLLHKQFCNALSNLDMEFQGTAFLRHYPPTQFMSTYPKQRSSLGIVPPLYQTISVFRKPSR